MPAPILTWGAGGDQAYQDYLLNKQQQKMNSLTIQSKQEQLQEQEENKAIQRQANDMMSTIMKGGNISSTTGGAPSGQDNPARAMSAFMDVGAKMMAAGQSEMGLKYIKAGQNIEASEANIDNKRAATITAKLNNRMQQSEALLHVLSAPDMTEAKWQSSLQKLSDTGLFPQDELKNLANIPSHPVALEYLRKSALGVKANATNQLKAERLKETERHNAATEANSRAYLDVAKQKKLASRNQRVIQNKVGLKAPTTAELKSATTIIKGSIFKDFDSFDADNPIVKQGVSAAVARAKTLMRDNQGLTWDNAVHQAISEQQVNGDWDKGSTAWHFPFTDRKVPLSGSDAITGFSPKGKRASDAMGVPIKDGKVQTANLKQGTWYNFPTGKTAKYLGNGKFLEQVQ